MCSYLITYRMHENGLVVFNATQFISNYSFNQVDKHYMSVSDVVWYIIRIVDTTQRHVEQAGQISEYDRIKIIVNVSKLISCPKTRK